MAVVDANGIPLGVVAAGANRHDSPLLAPPSMRRDAWIELPERERPPRSGLRLELTDELLESRGLMGVISEKGKPAPLNAGMRWVVERTNSWHNAHKKLVVVYREGGRVIDFWMAFSNVVIVVRRLIRKAGFATAGRPTLPKAMTYWRKLLDDAISLRDAMRRMVRFASDATDALDTRIEEMTWTAGRKPSSYASRWIGYRTSA